MKTLFGDIDGVVTYLDDVLIYGSDRVSHDKILETVLSKIKTSGLSLNFEKCTFGADKISFLGYTISGGTCKPDDSRIEPILSFPLPNNVRALQRFLGMSTYYSKYICKYSALSKILYRKINDFGEWQQDEIKAFEQIKSAITNAVLVLPSDNESLCLRTDASNDTVSAVLETSDQQPVFFCSALTTRIS